MAYIVKAACAVVKGAGYLYRGAVVPAGADPADVKRLADEGLLAEVQPIIVETVVEEETLAAGGEEQPSPGSELDPMTVDQLKAYAADHKIDLGDATKKDEIREAIDLALAVSK